MKIDDSTNKLPPVAVPTGKPSSAGEAAPVKQAKADKVSLSGTVKAATDSKEAPIDAAKVERIRDAIARGEFRIDADRIAGDMMAGARELLSQQR